MRYSLYETTACKVSLFQKNVYFFSGRVYLTISILKKGVTFVDKKTLFIKIEQYREEMMTLSKEQGLSSEAVLATSEKLDALIYAYLKRSS